MKLAAAPAFERDQEVMPLELDAHINDLERWARGAQVDARRDSIAFWVLKAPAIIGSATAGLFAHLGLTNASLILATCSSVCIFVDGLHPRGQLRNTHLRALHDIRNLTNRMLGEWRSRSESAPPTTAAREIIRRSEAERDRIARYVRDAEAALGAGGSRRGSAST